MHLHTEVQAYSHSNICVHTRVHSYKHAQADAQAICRYVEGGQIGTESTQGVVGLIKMGEHRNDELESDSDGENFAAACEMFEEFGLPDQCIAKKHVKPYEQLPVSAWDHTTCVEWLKRYGC